MDVNEIKKQALVKLDSLWKNGTEVEKRTTTSTTIKVDDIVCEVYLRNGMINHRHVAYRFYKIIDSKWMKIKASDV